MLCHENQNAKSIEEWKKRMKIFISNIKTNILWVIFFIALILFQTVYMHLAGISQNDCIYGLVLGSIVFLAVFCSAFAVYFKKYKKLQRIELLDIDEQSDMTETSDCIEQLYQDIVENQVISRKQMRADKDKTNSEMLQYYGMWVHQIKTPIAAMNLILQDEELFSDEQRNELEGELFKIEQYVEMVLSYLRMESETTDYVIKKCQLEPLVRQAVRKFAKQFIRKKIRIELRDLDREIITDEKWFSFVLEQLLSNSLKYTNRGTISIYMQENSLIIEDTGIGIEESDLPRIFEKGFTGYNGRVEQKSTGLGLYLCKTILHKIGFSIYAKSVKGKGTKMIIDMERPEIVVE